MKQIKTIGFSLLAASVIGVPLSLVPSGVWAETTIVQQNGAQQHEEAVVKGETDYLVKHYVQLGIYSIRNEE